MLQECSWITRTGTGSVGDDVSRFDFGGPPLPTRDRQRSADASTHARADANVNDDGPGHVHHDLILRRCQFAA